MWAQGVSSVEHQLLGEVLLSSGVICFLFPRFFYDFHFWAHGPLLEKFRRVSSYRPLVHRLGHSMKNWQYIYMYLDKYLDSLL